MEMSTGTSTKDRTTRRHLTKKDIEFDADYIRSMNSIHSHHDGNNSCDSSDSLETVSDEIPVWVYGEQRWISGINEETTCADLVSVLLADQGIPQNAAKTQTQKHPTSLLNANNPNTTTSTTATTNCSHHQHQQHHHRRRRHEQSSENRGFVITERWRRVEQILNDDTKILQIWSAWGHAKSEVKLTLRQLDPNSSTDWLTASGSFINDKDSGMGSPNGSSNSAIIRRRKHRASKATSAWVTQAQTLHPKSSKSSIEKLMKLILEQGETIQQQLAKLRDRELQITKIEEERHKHREKEHGKNYLLETYLNGLPEVEVNKEAVTAVNSDSGVQTEGATSSPEISSSLSNNQREEDDDDGNVDGDYVLKSVISSDSQKFNGIVGSYKEKPSHRERKLLKDHKQAKEFSSLLQQRNENAAMLKPRSAATETNSKQNSRSSARSSFTAAASNTICDANGMHRSSNRNGGGASRKLFSLGVERVEGDEQSEGDEEDNVPEKIEWMEKVVAINKHLQREEELLVRLGAKIRKYESESSQLTEPEVREALTKVNSTIEAGNIEIKKIETDLDYSSEQLLQKANILKVLSNELLQNSTISSSSRSDNIEEASVDAATTNSTAKIPTTPQNSNETDQHSVDPIRPTDTTPTPATSGLQGNNTLNLNTDDLYSFSQFISKPNYEFNSKNENNNNHAHAMTCSITELTASALSQKLALGNGVDSPEQLLAANKSNKVTTNKVGNFALLNCYPPPPQGFDENYPDILSVANHHQQNLIANAPILSCKSLNPTGNGVTVGCDRIPGFSPTNKHLVTSSPISFLKKPVSNNINNHPNYILKQQQHQHQQQQQLQQYHGVNMNIYATTNRLRTSDNINTNSGACALVSNKLGPKRLLSNGGICNQFESNSDTGLSSMGDDVLHMGTLV